MSVSHVSKGSRKGIIQCQFHMSQRAIERGLSNVSFTCLKGQQKGDYPLSVSHVTKGSRKGLSNVSFTCHKGQ